MPASSSRRSSAESVSASVPDRQENTQNSTCVRSSHAPELSASNIQEPKDELDRHTTPPEIHALVNPGQVPNSSNMQTTEDELDRDGTASEPSLRTEQMPNREKLLVPSLPMRLSPGGTLRPDDDHAPGAAELFELDVAAGVVRQFEASHMPSLDGSPDTTPNVSSGRRRRHKEGKPSSSSAPEIMQPKKSRRSLSLTNCDLDCIKNESDSDISSEFEDSGDEEESMGARYIQLLRLELNDHEPAADVDENRHVDVIADEEARYPHVDKRNEQEASAEIHEIHYVEVMAAEEAMYVDDASHIVAIPNPLEDEVGEGDVDGGKHQPVDINVFSWSEDYRTFTGHEETYTRTPGPTINEADPTAIFMLIWDRNIMKTIVKETNRFAQQTLEGFAEQEGGISQSLMNWVELTVGELYRYFALLILMSLDYRSCVTEYWTTDILEMPKFRAVMSRNRYFEITRFMHFVNNDKVRNSLTPQEKKLYKVQYIIDHCNSRFQQLYIPRRELSLDESLLLWKGRGPSWTQCIRTKAARTGLKSYDLCEAATGYLLNVALYTGKMTDSVADAVEGFTNVTAKVVLKLATNYLDKGHCLYMDNWYNQIALTRYLKSERHTDVVGTLSRNRQNVPADIKALSERHMDRGAVVSRQCGDISVQAWNDVKLVTTLSTFHKPEMVSSTRREQAVEKPLVVRDYNKYMGGVDLKDQMLSMYLMERKRGTKWYIKVFKRMLNTSLLNTYVIQKATPGNPTLHHRETRMKIALGLLARFPLAVPRSHAAVRLPELVNERRLDHKLLHIPDQTEPNDQGVRPRRRCKVCWERYHQRKQVITICKVCDVGLCFGRCWEVYHYDVKLTT